MCLSQVIGQGGQVVLLNCLQQSRTAGNRLCKDLVFFDTLLDQLIIEANPAVLELCSDTFRCT